MKIKTKTPSISHINRPRAPARFLLIFVYLLLYLFIYIWVQPASHHLYINLHINLHRIAHLLQNPAYHFQHPTKQTGGITPPILLSASSAFAAAIIAACIGITTSLRVACVIGIEAVTADTGIAIIIRLIHTAAIFNAVRNTTHRL